MKNNILIVGKNKIYKTFLKDFLISNDFHVTTTNSNEVVIKTVESNTTDLIILDLEDSGLDGLNFCRELRSQFGGFILILTGLKDNIDEVSGLEAGADDFIIKPVLSRLLLARIRNLLKRLPETNNNNHGNGNDSTNTNNGPNVIDLGSLTVDATRRTAYIQENRIDLTSAEFDLLWLLALNPGQIVTRDQIYRELRGIEYNGLDRSIDLRIARLRKKLGDSGRHPQHIKSIRSLGYLLVSSP